ncbi:MAG TPA: bifunctional UDP-sugar hydrolase/5'-nucleotidase [Candidatus Marinimicrobia bacterium]|nr:bifunctional UDP-sugar hydrolase/5'-nucleotidase [Candidatus Neomarinimicrobiota bacterium]HRS52373.1 bifunctional UDP-sugar hydrolase/5'-nucleotidase [Candidatus Neomarinimicrobiota bacterium]
MKKVYFIHKNRLTKNQTIGVFLSALIIVVNLGAEPSANFPQVVILHWNDMHSTNLPYKPGRIDYWVGGYANLAGYLDSLCHLYPQAIILNAGDDFQGSPISNLTRGLSQILILNKIQPTAFTLGNHEFDYGIDNLRNVMAYANFPILNSNLHDSTKNDLLAQPYVIIQSGNLNVAIIGVLTGDMSTLALPQNLMGIGILDPLTQIRQYVSVVKPQTDLIVLLSHCGFEEDSLLAMQLNEVDVIIGGHSHSYLRQPKKVNNILICQAGANGQFLGYLKANVNENQKNITSYSYELIETRLGKVKPSLAVAEVVDSLEASIADEMNIIIGQLATDWRRNSHGESNLGNWICDVIREYFKTDIAFMNSGGIRKDLKAGPIRVRDLWEISPFDNTIEIVELTGEQLKFIMQYHVENPRDLLQVSGLSYEYNSSQKKLIKLTVAGELIDDQKIYTFATNNFVISQFERFFGLAPSAVKITPTDIIGRDVLIEAVKAQRVIDSHQEGRIIDLATKNKR